MFSTTGAATAASTSGLSGARPLARNGWLTTLTLSPRASSNPTASLTSCVMSSISALDSGRSRDFAVGAGLAHVVHQHRHRDALDATGGLARIADGAIDLVVARALLGVFCGVAAAAAATAAAAASAAAAALASARGTTAGRWSCCRRLRRGDVATRAAGGRLVGQRAGIRRRIRCRRGVLSSELCSLRTTALSGLYCSLRLLRWRPGSRSTVTCARTRPSPDQRRDQLSRCARCRCLRRGARPRTARRRSPPRRSSATTAGDPADRPP